MKMKKEIRNKKRVSKISVIILMVFLLFLVCSPLKNWYLDNTDEFVTAKSISKLEEELGFEQASTNNFKRAITYLLTMPASLFVNVNNNYNDYNIYPINSGLIDGSVSVGTIGVTNKVEGSIATDYSTTNVQVENVDEADIVKTDGKYIYSISNSEVVITNAFPVEELEVVSKVYMPDAGIPMDIILNGNKMTVIGTRNSSTMDTQVVIFDISDKKNVKKVISYYIDENYYTCRAIDDELYIITTKKMLRDEILPLYYINGARIEMPVEKFKYLKEVKSKERTTITCLDTKIGEVKDVNSYALSTSNLYMSENNMYIISRGRTIDRNIDISKIFGFKGIFGLQDALGETSYSNERISNIYKFNIDSNGLSVVAKGQVEGSTLNQFSMDEYRGNLRVSLTRNNNNAIVVFDKRMQIIGELDNLAEGEKIYSTRFVGDRAYMVTYKTIDPLFVIDLKDPTSPKVLGELKIPGYSSYLHPYDEDTIIGIGMDTTEIINKDEFGKIISTNARVIGLKLALFDVSDVQNPIQKHSVTIGDSRTYSPILTNHKSLLFSKEKGILAIPVTGLSRNVDISINENSTVTNVENRYNEYEKYSTSRGLLVFDISNEAILKKGLIEDDTKQSSNFNWNSRYIAMRGIYLDKVLYAISDKSIKAVEVDSLELIRKIQF